MTYNSSPVHSRNQDLYQLKLSIQAHSKRTSQENQHHRPSAHSHTQTHVLERHIQERNSQANQDKPTERVMSKFNT